MRLQDRSSAAPLLLLVLCGGAISCMSGPGAPAAEPPQSSNCGSQASTVRPDARDEEWFVDRAAAAGIDFTHFNGMSGRFYQPEIMGPGVALFDYDNDGDLDIYLVQGGLLGPGPPLLPPPKGPLTDRLYRNDLVVHPDGTRTLHFTDVTEQSGLKTTGYGMGVAVGDFDNDGWVDLYRTAFGRNQLFHNNGDGTFTDVTDRSGTADPGWSVSASFVDFDRDGWLDLYVGNYLDISADERIHCYTRTGRKDYCGPRSYKALPDRLYRNRRDGTFVDVTAEAGVAREYGPALGVVAADFNGDGWPDIYVANDGEPNLLWINQQNGRFRNTALLAGAALNGLGSAQGSMGVDAGDFDNDGDEDLFVTNLVGETNTLYVNDGSGVFEDRTARAGLAVPSLPYTGFGTAWFDFDNDGWLDLLVANGAVRIREALARATDPFPLHERNQLFRNLGTGRFEEVTAQAGAVFELSEVSRGAAFGDVDNDGDIDVLVTNNNGPARLLINHVGQRCHWLGLRLVGGPGPRDMLGARVGAFRNQGPPLWRRARADGSYGSANDPRVLVGLGDVAAVPRVRVVWRSGRVEDWTDIAVDRWITLKEGSGDRARSNGVVR
ncbi:MAG: CRTAC1 family protein [Acidobacteria bacterium]|nr:CRTAC1 family protein [Acidobacteriota bacterium]